MQKILNKILNLIKQAYYSGVGVDDLPFPTGTLTTNGKESKFFRMSVYGICSNPTENSHILVFNAQGRESNKFGFINDFINRKKDLKEGEVALYNAKTGDFVYLKDDGIEVETAGDLDATVAGTTTLESIGDVNITAPNVNIVGDVNIEGDVDIVGDQTNEGTLDVTGVISSDADIVADSLATAISLINHWHQGNLGFPTGPSLSAGGGTTPSSLPTADSNGEITDGLGTKSTNHTHPYTWTDPGGSGNTGNAQ